MFVSHFLFFMFFFLLFVLFGSLTALTNSKSDEKSSWTTKEAKDLCPLLSQTMPWSSRLAIIIGWRSRIIFLWQAEFPERRVGLMLPRYYMPIDNFRQQNIHHDCE